MRDKSEIRLPGEISKYVRIKIATWPDPDNKSSKPYCGIVFQPKKESTIEVRYTPYSTKRDSSDIVTCEAYPRHPDTAVMFLTVSTSNKRLGLLLEVHRDGKYEPIRIKSLYPSGAPVSMRQHPVTVFSDHITVSITMNGGNNMVIFTSSRSPSSGNYFVPLPTLCAYLAGNIDRQLLYQTALIKNRRCQN